MPWDRKIYQTKSIIRLDKMVRVKLGTGIRDYIRRRVGERGQGMGGTVMRGYSTRPLSLDRRGRGTSKRFVPPVGGIPRGSRMFFEGGYRQYREKAGLVSDRFVLDNKGNAWRDFRVISLGSRGGAPLTIGVTRNENAVAFNAAQENGRPTLFLLDNNELSVISEGLIEEINKYLFD